MFCSLKCKKNKQKQNKTPLMLAASGAVLQPTRVWSRERPRPAAQPPSSSASRRVSTDEIENGGVTKNKWRLQWP